MTSKSFNVVCQLDVVSHLLLCPSCKTEGVQHLAYTGYNNTLQTIVSKCENEKCNVNTFYYGVLLEQGGWTNKNLD